LTSIFQQSKTVTSPDGSKATVTQKGDGAEEGGMVMATKGTTTCSVNAARSGEQTIVSLGLR